MNASEMTEKATQGFQEQAQNWKEKAQQWQQIAMDKARTASQATDDYVRQNTWSTVALAALVGCVLGFWLAKQRD
ncbi:MAG TPA: hypothetical protein VNZ22_21730 [Bacillota bacterium]|nr:hypothetical protein [Bacillota bacterium]